MTSFGKITVFTVCFLLSVFLPSFGDEKQVLENENVYISLVLDSESQRVYIDEIIDKTNSNYISLFDNDERPAPIWGLQMEGKTNYLFSNNVRFIRWETPSNDQLGIVWELKNDSDLGDLRFTATITLKRSIYWDFSVEAIGRNPQSFNLQWLEYPYLGDLNPDDLNMVLPQGWGREYHNPGAFSGYYKYPTKDANMQFMAYYRQGNKHGLYFAANDSSGFQKLIRHNLIKSRNDPSRSNIRASIRTIPSVQKNSVSWQLPFPMEIRPFTGGWFEASRIYRLFVDGWKAPNQRNGINDWTFDNDLFLLVLAANVDGGKLMEPGSGRPLHEKLKTLMEDLDANTAAIHLNRWHNHRFDDNYPNYFPPKSGFEDFLAEMKSMNVKVLPYINARIADIDVANTESSIYDNASQGVSGDFFRVKHNVNQFLTMCPNTEYWQNKIRTISERLLKEYGVDGVYYDEVGTAPSYLCVNASHNHPEDQVYRLFSGNQAPFNFASGNRWTKAVNRLFNPEAVSMTEDNGEVYNADIHLMVNHELKIYKGGCNDFQEEPSTTIPLFPAVYSGKKQTLGFSRHYLAENGRTLPSCNGNIDVDFLNGGMFKMALNFLYGSHISWVSHTYLLENEGLRDYMKSLLQQRKVIRDYFNFGEMWFPPAVEMADNTARALIEEDLKLRGERVGKYQFFEDPLQATFWKYTDDDTQKFAVMITNFTQNEASANEISLRLPAGNYFEQDLSETERKKVKSNGEYVLKDVTLSALSVKVFEFERR